MNRFKLDGDLFCRSVKVNKELELINKVVYTEDKEPVFEVNFRDLLWQYELQDNFSNDSEDSEDHLSQYHMYDRRSSLRNRSLMNNGKKSKKSTIYNELSEIFPSRNTFKFKSGIEITSNFDGGNLMYCQDLDEEQTHYSFMPEQAVYRSWTDGEEDQDSADDRRAKCYEYEVRVAPDGYPYMIWEYDDGREPGFFFSVSGIPALKRRKDEESIGNEERRLRFHFTHLTHQTKQMSFGHRPVYIVVSHEKYLNLMKGKIPFYEQDWQRIPSDMVFIN